jgi:hypothetical protein
MSKKEPKIDLKKNMQLEEKIKEIDEEVYKYCALTDIEKINKYDELSKKISLCDVEIQNVRKKMMLINEMNNEDADIDSDIDSDTLESMISSKHTSNEIITQKKFNELTEETNRMKSNIDNADDTLTMTHLLNYYTIICANVKQINNYLNSKKMDVKYV